MTAADRLSGRRLAEDSNAEFRLARGLYYLGMCFVAVGAIRPFGGLDVSDWLFFASLVVVAGTVVVKRMRVDVSLPGLFVFGFAILSVGAVFSLPVALHPADAWGAFARFTFTVVVWFALGAIVLRSRRHVEIAIAAWITSNAVSGLAAIAQVKLGALVFASYTTVPLNLGGGGFVGRQIGLSGHPNDLGGAAAIVVAPAILFAATRMWARGQRYVFIGLLCLVLTGIALSGSVTAFTASLVGAVIWSVSGRVAPKRLVAIAATLTFTSIALIVINQEGTSSVLSPIDRVAQTIGLETASSATGPERLNLDAIAWNEIARNPLYGLGLDYGSNAEGLGGIGVHNMFLFVWVGAGTFGVLGLLMMVMSLARTYAVEYRRSIVPAEQTLVLALGTSFVSFLIVTLAQPVLFVRYGWVPAALLVSIRASRLRSEGATPVLTRLDGPISSRETAIATRIR